MGVKIPLHNAFFLTALCFPLLLLSCDDSYQQAFISNTTVCVSDRSGCQQEVNFFIFLFLDKDSFWEVKKPDIE